MVHALNDFQTERQNKSSRLKMLAASNTVLSALFISFTGSNLAGHICTRNNRELIGEAKILPSPILLDRHSGSLVHGFGCPPDNEQNDSQPRWKRIWLRATDTLQRKGQRTRPAPPLYHAGHEDSEAHAIGSALWQISGIGKHDLHILFAVFMITFVNLWSSEYI